MRRLPAIAAVTVLGSACAITASGAASAAAGKTVLAGSIPAWANSKNLVGSADPSTNVGFRVYLGWNNPAAVASLAAAVSDPSSASYRQYLTPAQFRQQFAPSQEQV